MLTDTEFFTVTQALGIVRLDADDDTDRLAAVENARKAVENWFQSRPEHGTNLSVVLDKNITSTKLGEVSKSIDLSEKA